MNFATDLAKEVIIALLTAAFTWIAHHVSRLAKDLNAFFAKVRCLETDFSDLRDIVEDQRRLIDEQRQFIDVLKDELDMYDTDRVYKQK